MEKDNKSPPPKASAPAGAPVQGAAEQVVVQARPLTPAVEEHGLRSSKEAREKQAKALADARAKYPKVESVNTSSAKVIPNIGQPRAQTSEEIREDAEDKPSASGGVAKAAPYPGDVHEAQTKAIINSERNRIGTEFDTTDLHGRTVDGQVEGDTVVVRLLYDWWDGQGVRHPLNTRIEVPLNEARNLVDQRKAERTNDKV